MLRWLGIFLVLIPYSAGAATSTYEHEERQIPKKPSTPLQINRMSPGNHPHCERFFLYQGKKYECDSNLGRDADRLRPLMADVPSSLSELDAYQENRESLRNAAYVGSAGIVAALLGLLISHPPIEGGKVKVGGFFLLGGIGLAANSLIYGLSVVKANETHLGRAVDNFNAVHPDNPIELQFSTQVNF